MAKTPALPVPPVVSTRKKAPPATPRQMAKGGGPGAPPPPVPARTGRAVLPWEEILAAYLTPTVSEESMVAKWPTLRDLAERFKCSEQTLKEASSEQGWVKRQQLARDVWASERTEALNRQMAQGAAVVRMAAYQNGLKVVQKAEASLKVNGDMPSVLRAATATEKGLDIAMKAAGVPTVAQGAQLGVMVNVQQNNGGSGEGSAPIGGAPAGNLWATLVEARRFVAPAVDPYDAPSPLPPALASR